MFKLIIVEDENKTRSALLSCLPWESLGITEVGEASNGVQALEWIKRERPHLVITDIRMPEMDGLELVGRIREAYPHTGVIILSAYSDIPYLKSAIKYNAVDYLFKPVDPEELEQAISRALDRVRVSSQMSRVHGVLEEHLPLLREQWLKAIVNGVKIGDAEWENKRELYGTEIPEPLTYVACAIRLLDLEAADSLLFKQVVQEQIYAIVRHSVKSLPFSACFPNRDNELVLVIGGGNTDMEERNITRMLQRIRDGIAEHCQYRIAVWQGTPVTTLRDLARSYDQAVPIDPEPAAGKADSFSLQDRESLLMQSIRKYVETRYWNVDLTVADIAGELRYTSAYVCMIFKKQSGITLNHYINMYRISKAKELLRDVTLKLADIAEMVGYSSENYFSKVFKKYEGFSPSDYKRGG